MGIDQAYNFKKLNDLIDTAGLLSEAQLNLLGSEGYEAVINLLPDDNAYAIKNEASIVKAQGIIYEYIPVDFSAPTEDDYHVFSEKLAKYSNKKVMVHCAANFRVSAFYSIYAYFNHGWSESQVQESISSIWNLADYPAWEAFVSKILDAKNG
ncbi:MAG: protein tyrosine phosphatase family protein [Pseudomonadales bacterium]|nr:protein tyrosine phosphatase family protein [Pseudomonadales bacterium]